MVEVGSWYRRKVVVMKISTPEAVCDTRGTSEDGPTYLRRGVAGR